ncbi:MAG: ABC transporter substrate-binding protein [Reichenbachiella sp.]|uniref:ABC transporter substrate-binding protein n=1 Tax=Reichenbachiella sp. TaxID=2184521 RepID=UPI0032679DDD
MKQKRPHFTFSCLVLLVQLNFSCETKAPYLVEPSVNNDVTLNINFHDNVLTTNPLQANSRSEKFIADLVFDKFYNDDGTSELISSYSFDSLLKEHVFTIIPGKTFHDGSPVDSKAIKMIFQHLIEHHFDRYAVNSLFTSMSGFGSINWYRINRNVMDSIPSGFKISSEVKFSIKLQKGHDQLLTWLNAPEFILFSQKDDLFIGSGPFELVALNQDISAKLVKVRNITGDVKMINMGFIKNDQLVFSEFVNGSLDLIMYNPYLSPDSSITELISKIINNKYSAYEAQLSDQSVVRYAHILNLSDSVTLKNILNSLNVSRTQVYFLTSSNSVSDTFVLDSLRLTDVKDSSMYQIPLVHDIEQNDKVYFTDSKSVSFIPTNSENINPTSPHIVIKEIATSIPKMNDEKLSILKLAEKQKNETNSTILVLDRFPEYVIYNNRLKGIEAGKSLSSMVKDISNLVPKTY